MTFLLRKAVPRRIEQFALILSKTTLYENTSSLVIHAPYKHNKSFIVHRSDDKQLSLGRFIYIKKCQSGPAVRTALLSTVDEYGAVVFQRGSNRGIFKLRSAGTGSGLTALAMLLDLKQLHTRPGGFRATQCSCNTSIPFTGSFRAT